MNSGLVFKGIFLSYVLDGSPYRVSHLEPPVDIFPMMNVRSARSRYFILMLEIRLLAKLVWNFTIDPFPLRP